MATDSSEKIFSALAMQSTVRDSVATSSLSAGISFYQNKKYDRALQAFRQAAALKPDLVEAYTYQGYAYSSLGKKKEAIESFKLSLKVDKSQDTVYSTLANLYIEQNQKDKAKAVLADGIKQNKLNTVAYYTLGQLQSQDGDYRLAEANFRQVIKLEPKDGNGYYALGMALNGQGKYGDAITQLQKATSLKKDFAAAIYELGRAYSGKGDQEKLDEQIARLNKIGSSTARSFAESLSAETAKPKMSYYDASKSSLQLALGTSGSLSSANISAGADNPYKPIPLDTVNLAFTTPGTTKDVSVSFVFDSDMDPASVASVSNWSITKAGGGTAGIYNNGVYNAKNIPVPTMPKQVSYDASSRTATVIFSLTQNSSADGEIDPAKLVFKFMGKDNRGMIMDSKADEYDGYAGTVF